ncbi:hypothetical protein EDC94DRAFT_648470 [Helicostylum pulchrum]|nr:hypothetical protein EDC94DRAFT_648470 [Helicostylum pulchrum]
MKIESLKNITALKLLFLLSVYCYTSRFELVQGASFYDMLKTKIISLLLLNNRISLSRLVIAKPGFISYAKLVRQSSLQISELENVFCFKLLFVERNEAKGIGVCGFAVQESQA